MLRHATLGLKSAHPRQIVRVLWLRAGRCALALTPLWLGACTLVDPWHGHEDIPIIAHPRHHHTKPVPDTPEAHELDAGPAPCPVTHFAGNVVIDSDESYVAATCYETIDGCLTVSASAPSLVVLPNLTQVTGSVSITQTGVKIAPTEVERCGFTVQTDLAMSSVQLPALSEVGGSLIFTQEAEDQQLAGIAESVEVGLDALTSVAGDVTLLLRPAGDIPCGLRSLLALPGNLALEFGGEGTLDVLGGSLLTALTTVAGNVRVQGGFSVSSMLTSLESAGSLTLLDVDNRVMGFDQLTEVSGTLELNHVRDAWLTRLATVGNLRLVETSLFNLRLIGSALGTATLGGLDLVNNGNLATLFDDAPPNVETHITLRAAAPVNVSGPQPTLSAVCAFLAAQTTLGWSGSEDINGVSCP